VPISGLLERPAWEFDVLNLSSGESVRCVYMLHRGATAVNDLQLVFSVVAPANDPGPAGNQATWVAGSLTNLVLSVGQACDLPETPTARTVRVSLNNRGPTALTDVAFGTCLDNFFPNFSINGSIPGGCGSGNVLPFICFDYAIGWSFESLSAGETRSCLLRLEAPSQPTPGSSSIPIRIAQPYRSGPLQILDIEPDRPWQFISATSPSTCAVATPIQIPLGGAPWNLLVVGMMLLAAGLFGPNRTT